MVSDLYDTLANSHPSLARGIVWCRTCGREQRVDAADSLQHGWPKCCGYTMTIDSPEEQRAFKEADDVRAALEGRTE